MALRLLFTILLICNASLLAQDWNFSSTDANMTVQISEDVVSFDGNPLPCGSLIGAFFINNAGELICAGYNIWCDDFDISGNQMAIALWASESGLDNGFSANEEVNWLVQVEGQSYESSSYEMNSFPPFSNLFSSQGFGQVLDLDFFSAGCLDISACNYCEECAEVDNDLCQYPDTGYDCNGQCIVDTDIDGVCDDFEILGCTDINAANYNSLATDNDDSCSYTIFGCTNEFSSVFNIDATDDDGSCIFCNDPEADNVYYEENINFCLDDIINNYTLESVPDGLYDCCFYENPGCTDDGTCFDSDGDGDLDECDDRFLYINIETGESIYYASPFPGIEASNYNPNANTLIGIDYCYYFPACQDPSATNYGFNCNGDDILSLAQSNGFSVDFNEEPNTTPFNITFNGYTIAFEDSNSCCLYYSCNDPEADNYHDLDGWFYSNTPEEENYVFGNLSIPLVCLLDGSYDILSPDLPDNANVTSSFSPFDIDGDGILNSSDSDADGDDYFYVFQYTSAIDLDVNNPCVYFGCMDGGLTEDGDGLIAYNYDNSATIDDGSCRYYVCSDPSSMNYMSEDVIEENSVFSYCSDIDFFNNQTYLPISDNLDDCCQYLGCLDSQSFNYNPNATIQELVFTSSNSLGGYALIPILSNEGDTIGYEDTCFPITYGCLDVIAENYNDYDNDGDSNLYVEDSNMETFQLTNINIDTTGLSLFAIDQLDLIEGFNLYGNNINVNTAGQNGIPNIDPNSVSPCEYIYGCTDPCYIEYYDVVEYENEDIFNFLSINNLLNVEGCDFNYSYGCTELIIPTSQSLPTFDDGSCSSLLIYGCMDSMAENYNPLATVNDCLACIPSLFVDFEVVNPDCYNDTYGYIDFSIVGGVAPYYYFLYDNDGNEIMLASVNDEGDMLTIQDLLFGDYFLDVYDSINNNTSISFTIVDPLDLTIDLWYSGGWLSTVSDYDNYQWTFNGDNILDPFSNTFQIIPELGPGLWGVTASFTDLEGNECVSNTVTYFIDSIFVGINDNISSFNIECLPNPSFNSTILKINNPQSISLNIDVFDSFGSLVWSEYNINNNKESFIINNLAEGIYYTRVSSVNENKIIPIIILK